MVKVHQWTDEQKSFIAEVADGLTRKQIRQLFNYHFGLNLTLNQIVGFMKRNKINNNIDARFRKGGKAWNKGMKGLQTGGDAGWFSKGQKPHNYKPVGTERVNSEGYTDIKIADPNVWKQKHRIMWESENGPIPKGHVLIFGDGDKTNITMENMLLVTRSQLARLNQNDLIQNDASLTKVAIGIADIYSAIGKRSD